MATSDDRIVAIRDYLAAAGFALLKQGAYKDLQKALIAWIDVIQNNANLRKNRQPPAASLVGFMRTSPQVTIFD